MNPSSWAMRKTDGADETESEEGGGAVAMSVSSGALVAGGLEEFNKYFLSISPFVISGEMKWTPFAKLLRAKFLEITVESVISVEGLKIDEEEEEPPKRGRGRPRSKNPTKKAIELRERREKEVKNEAELKAFYNAFHREGGYLEMIDEQGRRCRSVIDEEAHPQPYYTDEQGRQFWKGV